VTDPALERFRADGAASAGFSDSVTFAFGDRGSRLFGLARAGLAPAPEGEGRRGSALGVLFSEAQPAGALIRGGVELAADADFAALELPGLRTTVEAPHERWRVELAAEGAAGATGFALAFEAIGDPAELGASEPAARAGGMQGYEQLCRVQGTVRVGGRERPLDGLGQRGHQWGAPDWSRIELARSLGAWLDDGTGVTVATVRPAGARSHAEETAWGAVLGGEAGTRVADPRLSTTSDAEGHQRRAGLELWMDGEEAHPLRGAGEALCGSTIDLGRLRLDCAFFAWHMEGREGVGRYDVLRRA
jgi:hypothetical protein